MDAHSISFFGQKTGMLLSSQSRENDFINFKFLKKKNNGIWEKPSAREGKSIKLNLREIVFVIDVLQKNKSSWNTVHNYQGDSTPITIAWENGGLKINVPGYYKFLQYPETKILEDLLLHLYEEKIIHSTAYNSVNRDKSIYDASKKARISHNEYDDELSIKQKDHNQENRYIGEENNKKNSLGKSDVKVNKMKDLGENDQIEDYNQYQYINPEELIPKPDEWFNNLQHDGEYVLIPGDILTKKEKAIAFQINGLNQIWLPTSQIKDAEFSDVIGGVWVRDWLIKKKLDDIFEISA